MTIDPRPHLVVVEDEPAQRDLLVGYLSRQNFRVTGVENGAGLRALVEEAMPSLVLLDIGLPDEDGLSLARFLRARSNSIGIVMVTAAGDTIDRVVGLETGADDYIAKPFEARELLARVKSVLRRMKPAPGPPPAIANRIRMGRRILDIERRLLLDPQGGTEETLAPSEFRLLQLFVDNPNRVLERGWLLETVAERDTDSFDRAIDLRVARLRKKIEIDVAHPEAIRTVRGLGYMFVPAKE